MKVFLYMTGKAWNSEAGKEISRILARHGFRNFYSYFGPGNDLKEMTMKGELNNVDELNVPLLSLDPVKGEFYECLFLFGNGREEIMSNRPKDLDPILGTRTEVTYKGKTSYEIEKEYEDRR